MSVKTAKRIRLAGAVLLLIYFIGLVYFLFLSEEYGRTQVSEQLHYNLIPFREIRRYLMNTEVLGTRNVLENLAGNVIGFVPLGALVPVLMRQARVGIRMPLVGFLASAIVELAQLCLHVGSFDVDDILLNTLGTLLGYSVFCVCNTIRRRREINNKEGVIWQKEGRNERKRF